MSSQDQFNNLATEKIPLNPSRNKLETGSLQKRETRKLEKSIFATVAYYDYFNYPLTAVEIYYYLIKPTLGGVIASIPSADGMRGNPVISAESAGLLRRSVPRNDNRKPSFLEITETMDKSEKLKKTIDQKNGFYFLIGREGIIKDRIQKKKLADEKLKKSKWILKFISCLPFIRFMAISGSMSIGNPDKKSDIDLLVVAKAGRIWTARAFLTFFALALGAYRHSDKTANRLCLNHYITDKTLAIDFGNLYKAEEYLNLFPVSGDINIYKKFVGANDGWLKKYIYPNFSAADNMNMFFIPQGKISAIIKQGIEYLLSDTAGDWLENQFKKIQVYCIEKNPLTNHPHSRIRYTDNNLVFHPILVEPEVIGKWEEKMRQFNANLS